MNKFEKEKKLDALKMFRTLVKTKVQPFKPKDLVPGSMISYTYIAKDKTKVWDKTPLTMILRRSKGYTLGLNFHWVPKKARAILLSYILKKNKKNIKAGLPLEISYPEIKAIVIRLKLKAVVRLYINKRMSKRGIVIPNEFMRKAIDLPAENFIGMSAENAYKLMVRKDKTKKKR
jgi:hypothetical protein